ncbi:ABC transporter substrate-binding protein [Streptomyces sp. VRA16 Mangrove soil]|uniref:ABC transporter substrate-binding protein n=1 Tax=Streptomyces sp. VRA16 Mangrove soil TaxID=2817434 RepID=UPI001A9DD3CF|nr:ABC transporter substrate-binding protein [Streptomyces sp. VRA16 Mangrove soil]MBO1332312.1 ABC transporter substrate-binding protein [Streptomyces sp. VRA16 Mangrove soil]
MLRPAVLRYAVTLPLAALCSLAMTACGGSADPGPGKAPAKAQKIASGVTVKADPALHAGLSEKIRSRKVVRVATDVPYPPFEMFTSVGSHDITGIDHDLGRAIGARLGVTFTFTPQKFDGLLPAVQAGKFDVVMSAMTDKKERQQAVDFVDYLNAGPGWLVKKGNPIGLSKITDVCGRTVGVQSGTHHQQLLKDRQATCEEAGLPPIKVLAFAKDSEAQLALRSGKVVADFLDEVTAAWVASTTDHGKTFSTVTGDAAVGPHSPSPMGIAVAKNDPRLSRSIQRALQSLMDDGTYLKILKHYHVPGIAIPKATVNAG